MPFTTAHTALAIPVKKVFPWLSMTGLMAGAMAPDLLYFLMLGTSERAFSHSWSGLVVFCIPAGAIFGIVFRKWFLPSFVRGLPGPLDLRLASLTRGFRTPDNLKAWITYLISVALGVLSHFFWDSWTHGGGVISRHIPWLLGSVE